MDCVFKPYKINIDYSDLPELSEAEIKFLIDKGYKGDMEAYKRDKNRSEVLLIEKFNRTIFDIENGYY